jgi:Methyltransferase domain
VIEFFEKARPGFRHALDIIEHYRAGLLAIGDEAPPAPRWKQDWFPRLDAAAAYSFVRAFKPARIIEVGSGHSTRFLVRAIRDEGLRTEVTTIDPGPRRSPKLLPVEFLQSPVQDVPPARFGALRSGDMVFIDSSHRYAPGSDVAFLLDDILPRLSPGVLVHVHDIFLPDAYPAEWIWRGYSEQQALARVIMAGRFECLFSSHYVTRWMGESLGGSVVRRLPLPAGAYESSLWLRIAPGSGPAPRPE